MNKQSRWMQGLQWAEDQIRKQGIKTFGHNIMVGHVWDFDGFDRGVLDCLAHKERMEKVND